MRRFCTAFCALSFLLLFIGGAFLGFERVALDSAVYDRIQARLDIYDDAGLSPEAQSRVNVVLAGYLRGDLPSIDIEEEVFGVKGEVFNEDEKAHMIDVFHLFELERTIRTACLGAGCVLLAAVCFLSPSQTKRTLRRGLKVFALILLLLATVAVLLWTTSGFDRLFLLFHELLFTNDLWLMDPRTDAMIRMLPSGFFLQIASEAGIRALVYGFAFTAAACLLLLAVGLIIDNPWRKQTS